MNYYPTAVSELSDEQLHLLSHEIEHSGVLEQSDHFTWPKDSWEQQAHDRWLSMVMELGRRDPRPRSPGLDMRQLNEIVQRELRPDLAERIFGNSPIFERLKRS